MKQIYFKSLMLMLVCVTSIAGIVTPAMAATIFNDTFETQNFAKWTTVDTGALGTWKTDKTRYAGKFSAQVVGPTGVTDDVIRKSLPTHLFSDVSISYWYKSSGLDIKSNGTFDRVFVEYTLDGVTWNTLAEINPNTVYQNSGWNEGRHTVPASQQFALRMRAQLSDSGDRVWFDNVTISGTPTESTQARCSDSIDNDVDGTIDRADADCREFYPALEVVVTGTGTVSSSPAGISCGLTCVSQFLKGTVVTLKSVVNRGVSFLGFSGACEGADNCVVTVTTDTQVGAAFAELTPVTLIITNNEVQTGTIKAVTPAISCSGICTESVYVGEKITLTATPKAGYDFVGWSGACAGLQSTCTVTITGDTEVSAQYIAQAAGQCGNAVVTSGEMCDDGNTVSGDGCSVSCTIEGGFACINPAAGASQCYWDSICPIGTSFISPNGWYGVCR
ncbi:hypothetical protein K2P47_02735 [Patescibacteria group bacterium]|nr:hypothetical protein [Patescibacteria group bacterium]